MREITVQDLKQRMDQGTAVYLLDVRQPWELEMAALPGTVLIPLHELPSRIEEVVVPEGALVVTLCHHGIRSLSAQVILGQAGIPALSLAGGIDAWSRQIDRSVPRY